MANDKTSDDMESTVRVDMNQAMDPYAEHHTVEDDLDIDLKEILEDEAFSDPSVLAKSNSPETDIESDLEELLKDKVFTDEPIADGSSEPALQADDETIALDHLNEKINTLHKKNFEDAKHTDEKEPLPVQEKLTPEPLPSEEINMSNTNIPSNLSNGLIPTGLAILGLVGGLSGVWMAMTAQDEAQRLSAELQNIQTTNNKDNPKLLKIQTQLNSLEQMFDRLDRKVKADRLAAIAANKPQEKPVLATIITPTTPIKPHKAVPQHVETNLSPWNVVIASYDSIKNAQAQQRKQSTLSIKTVIASVKIKGRTWHRVIATGFATKQQAQIFAKQLK